MFGTKRDSIKRREALDGYNGIGGAVPLVCVWLGSSLSLIQVELLAYCLYKWALPLIMRLKFL